jgi:hypothetical protein
MTNGFNEIHDAISEINAGISLDRESISLKIGSKPVFVKALEKHLGYRLIDDTERMSCNSFAGIKFQVDSLVPENCLVIMAGGEVKKIINFERHTND